MSDADRQEFDWIPASLTEVFEDCFAEFADGGVSSHELLED
ncbi:hypothetical protein [Isoalcanivorax indicus]|nr:hypothetical protein [Isoalcanivorax indicus]